MPIPGVETYEPDGAMPWPLVLVEGEEHSGKTFELVAFAKQCDKLGEVYWIPLDEGGHARMYGGRLPGKPFEIVKLKTGAYAELMDKITRIKAHAQAQHDAGEKPVALILDSMSGIWSGLHDWVNARHRETRKAKAILRDDPNADVGRAGRNLWNDADTRWRALVRELKTFPGLVVVTARGREISATDESGQPAVDPKTKQAIKTWSVEAKSGFTYYVDVWLRKRREEGSFVVSVRSVEHGKKPGTKEAKEPEPILAAEAEGREIEWLLFDVLGLDPATAYANEFVESNAGGLTDSEMATLEQTHRSEEATVAAPDWLALTARATTPDAVYQLHNRANRAGQLTPEIDQAMRARVAQMRAAGEQGAQVGNVVAAAQGRPAVVPEVEGETPQAADAPAPQSGPAAVAAADPAEQQAAEAEQRGMLRDELVMIAEIMGITPTRLISRKEGLGKGVDAATTEDLQKATAELRIAAITKLRSIGRTAEADAYAQVQPHEYDTRANLLGEVPGTTEAA